MKDRAFLVVSNHGIERLTKNPPRLRQGEIVIGLNVEIPNDLFVRPSLRAEIRVDDDSVRPVEIDAGVLEAISENIERGLGVQVALTVLREDEDASE